MKNTLIIGGLSGIGKSINQALSSRGDNIITASRKKTNLNNHIQFDILSNDVNDILSDSLFFKKKLDYLIFTHRYRGDNIDEDFNHSIKKVEQIINGLSNKFNPNASIVLIGSMAGRFVIKEQPVFYHATRAAIESLVRYYAVELGSLNIRVNCVIPDIIIKEENKNFFLQKDNSIRLMLEKIIPLKRMGTSEDVANLVDFLCSDKSTFITGQSILVDGGLSIVSQTNLSKQLLDINN
tara:strand:- start:56 stop:769 length:714 start_codon:yes stop_codon:yes gene_type:complete